MKIRFLATILSLVSLSAWAQQHTFKQVTLEEDSGRYKDACPIDSSFTFNPSLKPPGVEIAESIGVLEAVNSKNTAAICPAKFSEIEDGEITTLKIGKNILRIPESVKLNAKGEGSYNTPGSFVGIKKNLIDNCGVTLEFIFEGDPSVTCAYSNDEVGPDDDDASLYMNRNALHMKDGAKEAGKNVKENSKSPATKTGSGIGK